MRWGTRVNIWKTPTYLNESKCVFCPSCQAGLPVTLATWKRGRDHFYNYLFSLKKIMLGFDFSSLSSEGFIAWSPFFAACLNSACFSRASFSLIFFKQSSRRPRSSAISFSSKMWFYSLMAQVIYLALITHHFVVLVVFFCLCFPRA